MVFKFVISCLGRPLLCRGGPHQVLWPDLLQGVRLLQESLLPFIQGLPAPAQAQAGERSLL